MHFSLHLHSQRYVRPERHFPTLSLLPAERIHIPIPRSRNLQRVSDCTTPPSTRLVFRRPIIFSSVHSFVYFFFPLVPHCVHRDPFTPRSFTVKAVEYISCLIRALTILTRRSHRQRPFSFLFLCSLLAISQVSHAFLLLVFSSRHTTLFCLLSHASWALPTPILCESPALHGLGGRQSFPDLLGGVWFPSPCPPMFLLHLRGTSFLFVFHW